MEKNKKLKIPVIEKEMFSNFNSTKLKNYHPPYELVQVRILESIINYLKFLLKGKHTFLIEGIRAATQAQMILEAMNSAATELNLSDHNILFMLTSKLCISFPKKLFQKKSKSDVETLLGYYQTLKSFMQSLNNRN